MAAFDGELHLRLLGEQMLAASSDDDEPPWTSPLRPVALALKAVGAITAETAEAVLDDYSLAAALRDDPDHLAHGHGWPHHARQTPHPPVPPRRIVRCNRVIEHPQGLLHVRYVALSDDATTMAITFRDDAPLPEPSPRFGVRSRSGAVVGWGPPLRHVTDDRGTTARLEFTGSHDGLEWRGNLETLAPLAPDTVWLEIDGERLDLHGECPSPDVTVEDVEEQDPAHRYLWRLAASWRRLNSPAPNLRAVAEALVAAGALSPEDPCVDHVRTAMLALRMQGAAPLARAGSLPEPWRSMLGRLGRRDGRFGTVPAGAVTPAFDGITLDVTRVDSMPGSWQVLVDVVAGIALEPPEAEAEDEDDDETVPDSRLTWWARDDRGNAYLGEAEGFERHGARPSGRLEFRPALDPKATHVDLVATAETQRAVIRVRLRWRPLHGEHE